MQRRLIWPIAFGLISVVYGLMGLAGSVSLLIESSYVDFYGILALLQIAIGVGLIMFKNWARKLAVLFYACFLIIMLPISLFLESTRVIFSVKAIQWILAFAMVYFFSRPHIKKQFK